MTSQEQRTTPPPAAGPHGARGPSWTGCVEQGGGGGLFQHRTRGLPHPEPLLGLVLALQAQHDHVGIHGRDLQLVLLLPHLLLLVHDAAAQQVHVQLRAVILGGLVTLEEKSRGAASPGVPARARVCRGGRLGLAGPTEPKGQTPECRSKTAASNAGHSLAFRASDRPVAFLSCKPPPLRLS